MVMPCRWVLTSIGSPHFAPASETVVVEVATRYVEERAKALSAMDELWLWKEAIQAHVIAPALGGEGDDGEASA